MLSVETTYAASHLVEIQLAPMLVLVTLASLSFSGLAYVSTVGQSTTKADRREALLLALLLSLSGLVALLLKWIGGSPGSLLVMQPWLGNATVALSFCSAAALGWAKLAKLQSTGSKRLLWIVRASVGSGALALLGSLSFLANIVAIGPLPQLTPLGCELIHVGHSCSPYVHVRGAPQAQQGDHSTGGWFIPGVRLQADTTGRTKAPIVARRFGLEIRSSVSAEVVENTRSSRFSMKPGDVWRYNRQELAPSLVFLPTLGLNTPPQSEASQLTLTALGYEEIAGAETLVVDVDLSGTDARDLHLVNADGSLRFRTALPKRWGEMTMSPRNERAWQWQPLLIEAKQQRTFDQDQLNELFGPSRQFGCIWAPFGQHCTCVEADAFSGPFLCETPIQATDSSLLQRLLVVEVDGHESLWLSSFSEEKPADRHTTKLGR